MAGRHTARLDSFVGLVVMIFALLAMAVVAHDQLMVGPLKWHLERDTTRQGGIEAMLLAGLMAFAAWRWGSSARWPWMIALAGLLLYLRRHSAEMVLLVGLFYVEAMLAGGTLLQRRLVGSDDVSGSLITAGLLGLGSWMLLSLLLSATHLGYPAVLAGLLLVGGGMAIFLRRRELASVRLLSYVTQRPAGERVAYALLAWWMLVLGARSTNVVGYDSVWYIAQGDRVLAPGGSIFESLGLVSAVHYFPKLWEMLLLPLTAFNDIRMQAALGIAALAVLLALLWKVARRLHLPQLPAAWMLLMLATLAALSNSAANLKADVTAGCLLVAMCLQLHDWARHRRLSALCFAVAAAALAVSTKLIAIPYVGVAVLLVLAGEAWHWRSNAPRALLAPDPTLRAALVTLGICAVVALLFLLRTWMLAGVPTVGPDPLMAIWKALGMHLKEPVGTLRWTWPQEWAQLPQLFREWLFAPSAMPKIQIEWTGNMWAVFAALALGLALLRPRTVLPVAADAAGRALYLAMALAGLLLAVAWKYHSRGSDGNYFLFPVALATCLATAALWRRLVDLPRTRHVMIVVMLLFSFFHATQSFITTAWSTPGTRTWDLDFARAPVQPGKWRRERLDGAGLAVVAEHLAARPRTERGLSYGLEQTPVLLPLRMESMESISYSSQYMVDEASLLDYMRRFDIQYVLLANETPDNARLQIGRVRTAVLAEGWQALPDEGGTLYSAPPGWHEEHRAAL